MSIDDEFMELIRTKMNVERTVTGRLPVSPKIINFDLADDSDKANYCIAHMEGDHVVVDHIGTVTRRFAADISNKATGPKVSDLDFSSLEDRVVATVLKGRDPNQVSQQSLRETFEDAGAHGGPRKSLPGFWHYPKSETPSATCKVSEFSSRVCELGVKGCDTFHTISTGRITTSDPARYEIQKDGIKRIPND